MKINEKFKTFKNVCDSIYENTLAEPSNLDLLSRSNHYLNDLKTWINILKFRPEFKILEIAVKELEISFITLNFGFYSQSFSGLRFFLERSLVSINFSAQEIELKLWEKGSRDTYWSEIMDENNGVFSSKFTQAFFPELKDEINHFKSLTKKVYRECSEYVHGNNSAILALPENLEYSPLLFNEWHNKFHSISRIILFTLNLRYAKGLSIEDLNLLQDINSEYFNNIKSIQELH